MIGCTMTHSGAIVHHCMFSVDCISKLIVFHLFSPADVMQSKDIKFDVPVYKALTLLKFILCLAIDYMVYGDILYR